MRSYEMGDPSLDQSIAELVAAASSNGNNDLIAEIIVTALKLHRDSADRGELKLINTALKEMRYSNLVFSRHTEPKVTIFGSARLPESDPNYQLAHRFAHIMAERGWGVVTGAGPGIMEAGHRGAGLAASYGVNIRLPFEANANEYVSPDKTVNFKYFFTRKLAFVKESHAFALFPGGFGTLDETFELMTLIQTGKSDVHPIVLMEEEGTGYWAPVIDFLEDVLVGKGLISIDDLALFRYTNDPESAAQELSRFYANFHSQRYVAGKLVLRLRTAPDEAMLERLNAEYADLLVSGVIESIEPTEDEVRDGDALECARLALHFDRRRFGRLRLLIDELNTIVATPHTVRPPAPFSSEQADRAF